MRRALINRALITRSATVIAGLATALTLSACSFEFSVGPGGDEGEETTGEEANRNGGGGGTRTDEGGTDTGGTDTGDDREIPDQDPEQNTADPGTGTDTSTTDTGGESDVVTIPGTELAQSVKEAAEEESGVTGIDVNCRDLRAYSVGSSTTCDMEMPSGDKYFPLVKVTSINGTYVEYELEFPGVHF
ncbi:hypothetical protein [Brevibacterium ihuae]|uniref:hypothetical protein n=1 Tax=Brevibacterium ihuae TaxID=1631743 RepID=UPI000C756749|nr:hypothetical protein [Brevibacterium ihuae]